jgi:hypothetical protein
MIARTKGKITTFFCIAKYFSYFFSLKGVFFIQVSDLRFILYPCGLLESL